jgi:hypothetical protein
MEEKKVKKRLAFAFSKIIAQHFWQDMMKTTFLVKKKTFLKASSNLKQKSLKFLITCAQAV